MSVLEEFRETIPHAQALSSTAGNKFDELDLWLAKRLGVPAEAVHATYVGKASALQVRIRQPGFQAHVRIAFAFLASDFLESNLREAQERAYVPGKFDAMVFVVNQGGVWTPRAVVEIEGGTVGQRLESIFELSLTRRWVAPTATAPVPPPPAQNAGVIPALELDERLLRMIRLSVASSRAIMLVGPPGTGKTRLLEWVLAQATVTPQSFGLSAPPQAPVRATPDESWTARDLVGGITLDDGRLCFRPGHLLRAIAEDRWLILDEANRADMDRIFGPLLTWLSSDLPVSLGSASTEAGAAEVLLGWTEMARSSTENTAVLEAKSAVSKTPVIYRAGAEWRLLGTYNALDAQRVFRFGHALGRRFARVPVPALEPEDFRVVLEGGCAGLPPYTGDVIASLYEAHYEDPVTQLGHAIFLVTPPGYVRSGLHGQSEPDAATVHELVAEAYLIAAGTWLAAMDEADLAKLGERIEDKGQLPVAQWEWVRSRLTTLR